MHMNGFLVPLLSCVLLTASCAQQSEDDEWLSFGMRLITACRENNRDALMEISWTDLAEMRELAKNFGDQGASTEKQVDVDRSFLEESIEIFLRSYQDICKGQPAKNVSKDHWIIQKAPNSTQISPRGFILWVKTNGEYQGIKIEMVVNTRNGLRVADWIGGHGVPSMGQLWSKRAELVRKDLESCDYPTVLQYEYEYR